MLLRNHPLMRYHGANNWPTAWTLIWGEDKHPIGELGTLRAVFPKREQAKRCFLLSRYEESFYLGCLLFDDEVFCRKIARLLQGYRNRSITEIGSLDLPHTF